MDAISPTMQFEILHQVQKQSYFGAFSNIFTGDACPEGVPEFSCDHTCSDQARSDCPEAEPGAILTCVPQNCGGCSFPKYLNENGTEVKCFDRKSFYLAVFTWFLLQKKMLSNAYKNWILSRSPAHGDTIRDKTNFPSYNSYRNVGLPSYVSLVVIKCNMLMNINQLF